MAQPEDVERKPDEERSAADRNGGDEDDPAEDDSRAGDSRESDTEPDSEPDSGDSRDSHEERSGADDGDAASHEDGSHETDGEDDSRASREDDGEDAEDGESDSPASGEDGSGADDASDDSGEGGPAEDSDERDPDEDSREDGPGETQPVPQVQGRLGPSALMGRYRPAADDAFGAPVAWGWSTLPPDELEELVDLVDGFVGAYNEVWAMTDDDVIPPCWHRHAALAHDLSALAWAYYQAYRDPGATPDLALRFQAHLPGFRSRVDHWLGTDPAACRDGRHSRTWRQAGGQRRSPSTRDSDEERDAVILLGTRTYGFPT